MRHALIVHGGWDGHQPGMVAEIFRRALDESGFSVTVSNTLDSFTDPELMQNLSLIVPIWTMGKITSEQCQGVVNAVSERGVGMAGCHGGMCDSFRENVDWQFLTGGQWVAHPGNDGVSYRVRVLRAGHPITEGIDDFDVKSEQYYLHVDPSNRVLAVTEFPIADGPHTPNGHFDMPVIWTRFFGRGRVFYNSLGHQANIIATEPCLTLMRRGFLWAAKKD